VGRALVVGRRRVAEPLGEALDPGLEPRPFGPEGLDVARLAEDHRVERLDRALDVHQLELERRQPLVDDVRIGIGIRSGAGMGRDHSLGAPAKGAQYARFRRRFPTRWRSPVALDSDDVKTIAHLARIGLDEDERTALAGDLNTMLALVEELQAVDTAGVEPMAHPLDARLVLRDDDVTEEDRRDALQKPAPETEGGYFLVPRVIE